jgi:CHAT domain-containing protein
LSSLPRARAEGRSFQRTIPRENRLLIGSEASEQALKRIDLSPYSIVHLAAHAIVVDESPERSGVLLAPGSEGEDGLLQVREIVELPLHGKTVVLTACRSATGGVLAGEGPLSLSRSFLEAGAKAVVGGLWPLRDDEAELVVQHLAEQLAQGSSVASALHVAQSRLREQGKPVAAWAGLVALGDGATTPYPRGFERRSRAFGVAVALLAGLLIALLVAASRRRVTRSARVG